MKQAVKQISPNKAYRLFEKSRVKGGVYFNLPGVNKILYSRSACLIDGFVYCEIFENGHYSGYRIDTIIGSSANPAFIPSNNHMSPF